MRDSDMTTSPSPLSALTGKLWPCGIPGRFGMPCGSTSWCRHRNAEEVAAWLEAQARQDAGVAVAEAVSERCGRSAA